MRLRGQQMAAFILCHSRDKDSSLTPHRSQRLLEWVGVLNPKHVHSCITPSLPTSPRLHPLAPILSSGTAALPLRYHFFLRLFLLCHNLLWQALFLSQDLWINLTYPLFPSCFCSLWIGSRRQHSGVSKKEIIASWFSSLQCYFSLRGTLFAANGWCSLCPKKWSGEEPPEICEEWRGELHNGWAWLCSKHTSIH